MASKKRTPPDSGVNVGNISDSKTLAIGNNAKAIEAGTYIEQVNIYPEKAPALDAKHQLRPVATDVVERPEELAELRAGFAGASGRALLGLTGMGGSGKTVLGLVIAHELVKGYPDAQIFLDLKGATSPLAASDAMWHVIHSFEPTADLRKQDDAQLAALYLNYLADKKVLLFWDNARSADQVKPLLPPSSCGDDHHLALEVSPTGDEGCAGGADEGRTGGTIPAGTEPAHRRLRGGTGAPV